MPLPERTRTPCDVRFCAVVGGVADVISWTPDATNHVMRTAMKKLKAPGRKGSGGPEDTTGGHMGNDVRFEI